MTDRTDPYRHVSGVQALRGIAALAVCWFHLTGVANGKDELFAFTGQYGWLGVPAFFVISGFVIPLALYRAGYDRSQFRRFAAKRILRVDPPYFAAILFTLALNFAAARTPGFKGPPFQVPLAQIALHAGYLVGFSRYSWINAAFWTLALEFQYYLLIGALFALVVSLSRTRRVAFAAAFIALSFVSPEEILVTCYFSLFLMGITLFQFFCGLIRGWEAGFMLAALVAAAVMKLGIESAGAGLFAVIFILLYRADYRILVWFGNISYSLYLVHVPVAIKIMNLGSRFVHGHAAYAALLAFALMVCLLAAVLLNTFVERPAQALAARIKYRIRVAADSRTSRESGLSALSGT